MLDSDSGLFSHAKAQAGRGDESKYKGLSDYVTKPPNLS